MRGQTLVELLFVLTLLAVGAASLVPTARRLRDHTVATAGREVLVAGFTEARAAAVRAGGAELVVRSAPPAYRVDTRDRVGPWVPVAELPTRVQLVAGRDSTRFRFDRMGLGRFASGSIRIVQGEVARRLVISSYGRVRRR